MYIKACHYTCLECFGPEWDMCKNCPKTRGSIPSNNPIFGECSCMGDELIDYHQPMCLG